MSLRDGLAVALQADGLDPAAVERLIRTALEEDLAFGPDVTTEATVPADAVATGDVTPRSVGVLAGVHVAAAVFDSLEEPFTRMVADDLAERKANSLDGLSSEASSPHPRP